MVWCTTPTPAIWVSPTHHSRTIRTLETNRGGAERCLSLAHITTRDARVFMYGGSLTRTHAERPSPQLEPRLFRYKAAGGRLFTRQTTNYSTKKIGQTTGDEHKWSTRARRAGPRGRRRRW
ncbi:unnamed protein product [Ectocarpus sp. 8 AP-2014]